MKQPSAPKPKAFGVPSIDLRRLAAKPAASGGCASVARFPTILAVRAPTSAVIDATFPFWHAGVVRDARSVVADLSEALEMPLPSRVEWVAPVGVLGAGVPLSRDELAGASLRRMGSVRVMLVGVAA